MTREDARKAAEVMFAYADGKEIEWKDKNSSSEWVPNERIYFNWEINDYRVKPEPKYRPFNSTEECWKEMQKHQPFGWIKDKCNTTSYETFFITGIMESRNDLNKILFTVDGKDFAEKRMFDECVFADGTPFGILEESV